MADATRERSAIYVDADGNRLFVAALRMWAIRDAMEPGEVLQRAKLAPEKWDRWRNKHGNAHWVLKYCYGDPPPEGVRVIRPFEQRPKMGRLKPRIDDLQDGTFPLDEGMPQFRKVATAKSAERWAAKKNGTGNCHLSITHWLEHYSGLPFIERWLLHREPLPADLHVARPSEVTAALTAWIPCERVSSAYYQWFEYFPTDEIPEWTDWLFGGAVPAGRYVIDDWILDLKQQLSPPAVCSAAGVAHGSFVKWRDDAVQFAALQQLIGSAARNSPGNIDAVEALRRRYPVGGKGPNSESFEIKLGAMKRYAEHATLSATVLRLAHGDEEEAKRLEWRWRKELRRADATVAEAVRTFVFEPLQRDDRCGVIGDVLFLPTESMRSFRENAVRVHHRLSEFPADCVRLWFLDSTLPARLRQRFLIEDGPIILAAGEPDGPTTGGGFRWKGAERFGLSGLARPLVTYLWNQRTTVDASSRRQKRCPFADLGKPLYGDDAKVVTRSMFKNPQREANRFFRASCFPFKVGSNAEGKNLDALEAVLTFLEKS